MNQLEKLIKENTEIVSFCDTGDVEVIEVKVLLELLKTHTVVPRKSNYNILSNMESVVRDECKDFGWARQQYRLAIEAAEKE